MNQLERNIGKAITQARKDGVRAMSLANLKQITSTEDLQISVEEYNAGFDQAAQRVAASRRFTILIGNNHDRPIHCIDNRRSRLLRNAQD